MNGHYADPKSTRDLTNITAEELDHLRMSCEAGRLEAETYLAMEDDELKATFERNTRAISAVGLCEPLEVPEIDGELRDYLRTRLRACGAILHKVGKARNGAIKGITPLEYEHLVTSLQAGYREAEVLCMATNGGIAEAFGKVKEVTERLGIEFQNPYSDYCSDCLEFFLERAEILWDVIRCVNQPYQDADKNGEFGIFA